VIAQRRLRGWISPAVAAIFVTGVASAAPTSLVDLLRSLSAGGLDILYSSDLVGPELMVPSTLRSTDALGRAREALAAFHLELRNDGQNRYVVTRSLIQRVAAQPATPPSQQGAEEVTVFASRYVLKDEAFREIASIHHDDLEHTPGAQEDAMRAIRTVPGLANNLSSRPYVRGAFLDDVLVRFDGIPMVDPFHFKNFTNLISAFDPATVDRIDVYTGGFPVEYGTRSAGVIDIAPRTVDSGYEHRLGANLYSYDLSTVGRADRWPVDWLATARHSTPNVTLQPRGGDLGEPSYSDVLGRVRWQITPNSGLILGWMLLDDEVQSSSEPSTEQAITHDRDLYTWVTSEWALTGAVRARTSLALTSSERSLVGNLSIAGAAQGQLDHRRDISTVDLRTDWTYLQTESLLWEVGAETTFESADLNFSREENLDPMLAASLDRSTDATLVTAQSPKSTTGGLFASARRHWSNLEAEFGVRLDHQDYRDLGSHSQVSPRVNLRFDPTPVWHLYGSWGHFRQAERVGEWRSEENQTTPDPATHTVGLVAGVSHDTAPFLHWRVEVYNNHWTTVHPYFDNSLNRLSYIPELGLDRVLITPHGGDSAGIETSVRGTIGDSLVLSASYALSKATDDLQGRDVPRSWDQPHAFNANIAWQHALTSASVQIGWHSGWPRTPIGLVPATATTPAYLQIGPRNSGRWGSYLSADVRLAHTIPVRLGDLLLWADATNLTNRGNECCTSFQQSSTMPNVLIPGISSWYPRVVNVGFEWRLREGH
jgi:TonB dependent receptor/TonB-dependent Receptor Plug Domain